MGDVVSDSSKPDNTPNFRTQVYHTAWRKVAVGARDAYPSGGDSSVVGGAGEEVTEEGDRRGQVLAGKMPVGARLP